MARRGRAEQVDRIGRVPAPRAGDPDADSGSRPRPEPARQPRERVTSMPRDEPCRDEQARTTANAKSGSTIGASGCSSARARSRGEASRRARASSRSPGTARRRSSSWGRSEAATERARRAPRWAAWRRAARARAPTSERRIPAEPGGGARRPAPPHRKRCSGVGVVDEQQALRQRRAIRTSPARLRPLPRPVELFLHLGVAPAAQEHEEQEHHALVLGVRRPGALCAS